METKMSPTDVRSARDEKKLAEIGRRVVLARLYERRRRQIDRQIVECVHRHINASAGELKERLEAICNEVFGSPESELDAEIAKLR